MYVHACIAFDPCTCQSSTQALCSVDNNLNVSPTHTCQHRLQPNILSTALCLCTFPTKVRCTYMPALPSSLAGVHVNRPYAVSLNISSHLLHDGMFKSTSCVQALSTFTTKFHHVHTFYLSANACLNYRQPRPYP